MNKDSLSKIEVDNGKVLSSDTFETVNEWLGYNFRNYEKETALEFEGKKITYQELDTISNKIANYLVEKGISKGDRVGICLRRSPEMIATILGVLKAGAAYVPLDVNYPVERLKMMSEAASLKLLIAHRQFLDRFKEQSHVVNTWEDIEIELSHHSERFGTVNITGQNVAYVIFTSGSTGRPKGIEMPHRGLANLIEWQLDREYFKERARVLQYSSISFDVSFQEIATTLSSGGTLILVNEEDRKDPRILLDILNKQKVERLFIPYVALRSLVEVANTTEKYPAFLKEVITAGEQLRVDNGFRSFFQKLSDVVLENQYGPSETHVISAYLLDDTPTEWPDLPPIGKPIKNNNIYILDEDMKRVKNGKEGELYLAGKNLAHGYIGRPELTKKVFLKSPVEIEDYPVMYKTGDLGLYNDQGDIEFLGRADHQIKIRGHRVEPGEIDTVGATYPGISQCITHVIEAFGNHTQLVTYYLSKNGTKIKKEKFKAFLGQHLPAYMVPAFVMELTEIPYTPSGKVDVKSLPKPASNGIEIKEEQYKTKTEYKLAKIWSNVLGVHAIGPSADFFDLGGDSLNAVTLFMKIDEIFGKNLPLATLTQASKFEELAKVIDQENPLSNYRSLQLIKRGDTTKVPLFLVHGGAGNVLMFNELAKSVSSDQPVYAFQWPGWDGRKAANDIRGMAEFYKKELLKAFPEGPYLLGGHCIGGIIALELANLLKETGAEVLNPVLVVDSPNLYSKNYYPGEPDKSAEHQEIFEQVKLSLEAEMAKNRLMNGIYKKNGIAKDDKKGAKGRKKFPTVAKILPFYSLLGRWYSAIRYQLRDIKIRLKVWASLTVPVSDRQFYSGKAQLDAIRNHSKISYDGDILYLKSEVLDARELNLKGWWDDKFFGFKEICTGHFDGYIIGGRHDEILKNPIAHKIINEKVLQMNA